MTEQREWSWFEAIRELLIMAYTWPVDEWRQRTLYGRVMLPLDYLGAVAMWASVIAIVPILYFAKILSESSDTELSWPKKYREGSE